ncbi:hypothetical protein [Alicyclobacillus sp. SO9]|uniref:hypothetical protein n=1 Tax=Alicyclobacillus sp. SO9 TaxID=2665646 RepID=UPI0018E7AF65|nr:hypothetical protein [Alicyclobacillus sp. SO9]QQE77532.1 hypothetical protein GI364_16510 [Alicyclobacillus sp. SO9]
MEQSFIVWWYQEDAGWMASAQMDKETSSSYSRELEERGYPIKVVPRFKSSRADIIEG